MTLLILLVRWYKGRKLIDNGATEVYACATHGVLSGPAIERLKESPIKELVITDTIPLTEEKKIEKIKVRSVAPLFAEAILRIHEACLSVNCSNRHLWCLFYYYP